MKGKARKDATTCSLSLLLVIATNERGFLNVSSLDTRVAVKNIGGKAIEVYLNEEASQEVVALKTRCVRCEKVFEFSQNFCSHCGEKRGFE